MDKDTSNEEMLKRWPFYFGTASLTYAVCVCVCVCVGGCVLEEH